MQKDFNGENGFAIAHKLLTEDEVYKEKEHINVVFGKNKKWPLDKNIWKKSSVFFDLPYWSNLDVRYYLDVMHVEKNVCVSLTKTLLNIQGNNKNNKNSHLDMAAMGQ